MPSANSPVRNIERGLQVATNNKQSKWIILFPEAEKFTATRVKEHAEHSIRYGFKRPFKHLLYPRFALFSQLLPALRDNSFGTVYNLTIDYEYPPSVGDSPQLSLSDALVGSILSKGSLPIKVNLHIEAMKLNLVPTKKRARVEEWLERRWAEKDQRLST